MSFVSFGNKTDNQLLSALMVQIDNLHREVNLLIAKMGEIQDREQRRYDELLKQFVNLAAVTNRQPMPNQNPDSIGALGLFEEVPLGNEKGYTEEELTLGGAYQENKQ